MCGHRLQCFVEAHHVLCDQGDLCVPTDLQQLLANRRTQMCLLRGAAFLVYMAGKLTSSLWAIKASGHPVQSNGPRICMCKVNACPSEAVATRALKLQPWQRPNMGRTNAVVRSLCSQGTPNGRKPRKDNVPIGTEAPVPLLCVALLCAVSLALAGQAVISQSSRATPPPARACTHICAHSTPTHGALKLTMSTRWRSTHPPPRRRSA